MPTNATPERARIEVRYACRGWALITHGWDHRQVDPDRQRQLDAEIAVPDRVRGVSCIQPCSSVAKTPGPLTNKSYCLLICSSVFCQYLQSVKVRKTEYPSPLHFRNLLPHFEGAQVILSSWRTAEFALDCVDSDEHGGSKTADFDLFRSLELGKGYGTSDVICSLRLVVCYGSGCLGVSLRLVSRRGTGAGVLMGMPRSR